MGQRRQPQQYAMLASMAKSVDGMAKSATASVSSASATVAAGASSASASVAAGAASAEDFLAVEKDDTVVGEPDPEGRYLLYSCGVRVNNEPYSLRVVADGDRFYLFIILFFFFYSVLTGIHYS